MYFVSIPFCSASSRISFPSESFPTLLIMFVLMPQDFILRATFKGAPPIFFPSGKRSQRTSPKQTTCFIIYLIKVLLKRSKETPFVSGIK